MNNKCKKSKIVQAYRHALRCETLGTTFRNLYLYPSQQRKSPEDSEFPLSSDTTEELYHFYVRI